MSTPMSHRHAIRAVGSILIAALFGGHVARAAETVGDLSPTFAQRGQSVTLKGTGFTPATSYTLTVNGVAAAITSVQPDQIQFTVPSTATTGFVELTPTSGTLLRAFLPLSITRSITATFAADLAASVGLAGYRMGTMYTDAAQTAAPFTIEVARGEPTLVVAARGDEEAVFTAIVTDGQASIQVGALTSALAQMYLVPPVFTGESGPAAARLAYLAALPETQQAATRIQLLAAAGTDFTTDTQLRRLLGAAITKWSGDDMAPQRLRPKDPKDETDPKDLDVAGETAQSPPRLAATD